MDDGFQKQWVRPLDHLRLSKGRKTQAMRLRSQSIPSSAVAPLGFEGWFTEVLLENLPELVSSFLPIFHEGTRLTDPWENGIADACRERTWSSEKQRKLKSHLLKSVITP